MNTTKKPKHAEPIFPQFEAKTEKPSKMSDYYDTVVRGLRRMEGNKDAIQHFFTTTEPQGEEPKHSRALDVDKAIGVAGEFIHNVEISILTNANRMWVSQPNGILPSAETLEQPLDYKDANPG